MIVIFAYVSESRGLGGSRMDNVAIPGSISVDLRVMLGATARRRVLKLILSTGLKIYMCVF